MIHWKNKQTKSNLTDAIIKIKFLFKHFNILIKITRTYGILILQANRVIRICIQIIVSYNNWNIKYQTKYVIYILNAPLICEISFL